VAVSQSLLHLGQLVQAVQVLVAQEVTAQLERLIKAIVVRTFLELSAVVVVEQVQLEQMRQLHQLLDPMVAMV
jgi:hypothetical protein